MNRLCNFTKLMLTLTVFLFLILSKESNAAPLFSIKANSPSKITVPAGSSSTFSYMVTNGYAAPMYLLSYSISPANITLDPSNTCFTSNSGKPALTAKGTCQLVLRVSASKLIAGGTISPQITFKTRMGITKFPNVSIQIVAPALQSIAIAAPSNTLSANSNLFFTATGTYTDTSTKDITTSASWSSSNTKAAIVGAKTGLARGQSKGGATNISAKLSNITSKPFAIQVSPALSSISLTPASNTTIFSRATQAFTALGTYADNSTVDLTKKVSWIAYSSPPTTIAVTIDANGVATGTDKGGKAFISASFAGITSSAKTLLTVTPILTQLSISPTIVSLNSGQSATFTASGTYSDGSIKTLKTGINWLTSDPILAPITTAGVVLTPKDKIGSAKISASTSGLTSNTASLTVGAFLQSIDVTPGAPTIFTGAQQQFTAVGHYSDGTTQPINPTWLSSSSSIASIVKTTGLATAAPSKTGKVTIAASLDQITNKQTVLTVAPALTSVVINASTHSLPVGKALQFTGTGNYSNGTKINILQSPGTTWNSNSVAATVVNGLATGKKAGTATITATYQNMPSNLFVVNVTSASK